MREKTASESPAGGGPVHRDRLLQQAGRLLEALYDKGIEAELDIDSLREYSVGLRVGLPGEKRNRVTIYYKPTRRTFSCPVPAFRDRALAAGVAAAWARVAPAGDRAPVPARLPGVHIYVDGSSLGGRTGYGAVVLVDGRLTAELSGAVPGDVSGHGRQVAGEIEAVLQSLEWCRANGVRQVTIHYDYRGLAAWVTGHYRANLPLTRDYRDRVRASGLDIRWVKVRGHSGDRWNEAADRLARRGAGAGKPEKKAPPPAAGPVAGDPAAAAGDRARGFAVFLAARGVETVFRGLFNGQYARLEISAGGERAGFFDLYNTARRPMSPYLHGFTDNGLRDRIDGFWGEFRPG